MESANIKEFSKSYINNLPNEMLQHIFGFLPRLKDRKTLSLVCHRWNDLAFDWSYLSLVSLHLVLDRDEKVNKMHRISRYYRSVQLRSNSDFNLNECETKKILTAFEKPSTSLEEFVTDASPLCSLSLRLLSKCPCIKKVQLDFTKNIPDDELPILENLEELAVTDVQNINIIYLAPNLRKLHTKDEYYNIPAIIQTLPVEHLRVKFQRGYAGLFLKYTKITKLTSLDLYNNPIDKNGLEKLCKFCPLLTKLRITIPGITSLHCLASLTHLKVLDLHDHGPNLLKNNYICLPNVEILAFNKSRISHFINTVLPIFPNVHYLKFGCHRLDRITGRISNCFPQLRTLELRRSCAKDLFNLLEGLSDLRELIMRDSELSDGHLPPMNLQQLTLKDSKLVVTQRMTKKFPTLKFLNLFGYSRYISANKMPSGCTVRRYLRDRTKDLFDVV